MALSSAVLLSQIRTTFDLNIPHGVDYPIAFTFTNSTKNPHYRAKVCVRGTDRRVNSSSLQLYVNGYQFGRYSECFSLQQG